MYFKDMNYELSVLDGFGWVEPPQHIDSKKGAKTVKISP